METIPHFMRIFPCLSAALLLLAACDISGDDPGIAPPGTPPPETPLPAEGPLAAMSAWFAAQPANTRDTPYEYALTADLADLAADGDGLGALLSALGRRYASIDLSGAAGAEIAAGPSANSVRLNARYLVSVTLPASLTGLGKRAFAHCSSLSEVHFLSSLPPALSGNDVFADTKAVFFFQTQDPRGSQAWPGSWNDRYRYRTVVKRTFTAGGLVFSMTEVPAVSRFPTGVDDSGTGAVEKPYFIAETETTWELWDTVLTWALEHGYAIQDAATAARGAAEPVRNSYYNFAVWCNALTEWYNEQTGASLSPAYHNTLKDIGSVSRDREPGFNREEPGMPFAARPGSTGFRMPTPHEWELAARWRGADPVNTVPGYSNPYFTKGNSVSGASASVSDTAESGRYAYMAAGMNAPPLPVKSLRPNALGLYDMSGNVWEWVDSWFYASYNAGFCNIQVRERGGAWNYGGWDYAQIAYTHNCEYEADGGARHNGIRLVLPVE